MPRHAIHQFKPLMSFLGLTDKTIVIFGVANRKSVAYSAAKVLESDGAHVIYVVRNEARREKVAKLLANREVFVCDVEHADQIETLRDQLAERHPVIHGFLHSIAFADYEGGMKPFHETGKQQFLRAVDVSCFSFIALSNALRDILAKDASAVTVSISTTRWPAKTTASWRPSKRRWILHWHS